MDFVGLLNTKESAVSDYDLEITDTDEPNPTEIIRSKVSSDSLCFVYSPDMAVISIVGSSEKYTSPDCTFFKLLESMNINRDKTVHQVLLDLDMDIVFKK